VHASGHSCRTVCTPQTTFVPFVCVCVCVCVFYREKESERMHQGTAAEQFACLRPPFFVILVCVCCTWPLYSLCVCFTGRRRVSACIRAQLQNCVYASDHLFLYCLFVCVVQGLCTLCLCVLQGEGE